MAKLSDSEKSNISSELQAEISSLTSLQGNINNDTSTTTLGSDMKSITQAYRIYALIVPQGSITAASDRVNTLVASFTTIGAKLQTRISAMSASSTAMSSITSALADFSSKVSDAGTQAIAAAAEVANLAPDNGDKTILASNTAALKDARLKIETATKDLTAARKDAGTIVKAIQSSTSAGPSATATTSTQ